MDSTVSLKVASQNESAMPMISPDACVRMLSTQYASRGIVRAAQNEVKRQCEQEAQTANQFPSAYRLSALSEAAIGGCYRRGKKYMSSDDLIRYFNETEQERHQSSAVSDDNGMDVLEKSAEQALTLPAKKESTGIGASMASLMPSGIVQAVKERKNAWLNFEKADTSRNRRTFPVSAVAAIATVAMSLMLIVAGSVMLTNAESQVAQLKKEITTVSAEVAELKSDNEIQHNLLQVREIAVNELGMVEEDYIRSDYMQLAKEDSIEAFEAEKEEGIGLSGLLSALGFK
jgi:cell division protein FtsB